MCGSTSNQVFTENKFPRKRVWFLHNFLLNYVFTLSFTTDLDYVTYMICVALLVSVSYVDLSVQRNDE